MKLVCYDTGEGPRAGVLQGEEILDAAKLLGESGPIADVRALLELPNDPLDRLREQLEAGASTVRIARNAARLRAPILQPPTLRDFFDYEGHASGDGRRELPDVWYRLPVFYFSNTLRIFGPEEDVPYPSASNLLDYELELACVIGKGGT